MDAEIKLGDTASDTITGFEGVVVARTEWLNGCIRITIQPRELKDGKPIESHTFDVQQVALVQAKPRAIEKRSGGPQPEPTRAKDPSD